MSNIIAIVGRPNVGKSTLFNRLIGQRKAIMDNVSGVTRDRHYGFGEWCGKPFTVIDTGGYVHNSDDIFEEEIRKQVLIAMNEADVILFMVDLMEGIHDLDREFANYVRRTKKPVLVVANKADTPLRTNLTGEFYALGVGKEIYPVSSQTGSGTGELLDEVVTFFKAEKEDVEDTADHVPRIAIVGRPNVGKSSLLNVLLSAERSIVTDIAGTTRDSIDTNYKAFGMNLILTDTAGLRKKTVEKEDIEFYSGLRTVNALENCDVCICMIDAERGFESQDVNIIALAAKNKKAIVVVVNKWDLVEEKDSNVTKDWDTFIKSKLAPMDYFPIIYTSVHTKQRIHKVLEKVVEVYQNKKKKIPTSQLNEIMLREIDSYPPPANGGRYVKIKYITQLPTKNPTFAFFCSNPKYIKEPYTRYLENKMRLHFGFDGVPITLIFKQK